jgi:uncharacterized protein with gpF-like domain
MANKANLPFEQMIEYFRKKLNLPTASYKEIYDHLHNQYFVVAGAMKMDLLQELRESVDEFISTGAGINEFRKRFTEIVEKHGWEHTGTIKSRARVIYDTNIRQAYAAGREVQINNPELRKLRPFGLYRHGGSKNPRDEHLAWDGKVLPLDDPWWDTHTPKNDYNCSCLKFTLSKSDVKRLGLEVTSGDKMPFANEFHEVEDNEGNVKKIPKGIGFGFNSRPTIMDNKEDFIKKDKYHPDLYSLFKKDKK